MSSHNNILDGLGKRNSGEVLGAANTSLRVESGQIIGFLGPISVGNSTIMILTLLTLSTCGTVTVRGFDVVSEAGQVRQIRGEALQGRDLCRSGHCLAIPGTVFPTSTITPELRV